MTKSRSSPGTTDQPEPERQLKSREQGLPGGENSTEKGGHNRVKKLDRHKWMPTDQPNSIAGALRLPRLNRLVCSRIPPPTRGVENLVNNVA